MDDSSYIDAGGEPLVAGTDIEVNQIVSEYEHRGMVAAHWCRAAGVLSLLWMLSACGPPPGVGRDAELGYSASQPVIEALEAYKTQRGEYPRELRDLAAGFLATIPEGPQHRALQYRRVGDSYKLTFKYAGPGMNKCTYSPRRHVLEQLPGELTKAGWVCSGYY